MSVVSICVKSVLHVKEMASISLRDFTQMWRVTKIYRYSLKCIKNGSEFDLQKNGKYKFSDAVLNAIESK